MSKPTPSTPVVRRLQPAKSLPVWPVGLAVACLAMLLPTGASAQKTDTDFDQPEWTGRVQDAAGARKEAEAALAEGRRECSRQAGSDRAACLKLVEADHKAALQRLKGAPAANARAQAKPKP